MERRIEQLVAANPTHDGQGVRLMRSIVGNDLRAFDPFLMLDEFCSDQADDYIGGFPEHPHRGFDTVTYMLAGSMQHRDHLGNTGRLGPGDVQWMTAAHGILHSEMPQQENGLMHGFQLWINLPASEKMKPPAYQEFTASEIPALRLENGTEIKLIAGQLDIDEVQLVGAVSGIATRPVYADILLAASSPLGLALPAGHKVLVYCYEGSLSIGADPATVGPSTLAVLSDGDMLRLNSMTERSRCLLLAGIPLDEPIAHAGPFVMNTEEELQQAFEDYRRGVLTEYREL